MKHHILLRFFFLVGCCGIQASLPAQGFDGIYSTIDGLVEVRAVYNDSLYRAYSNRLRASLNYDNASMILNLDLSTLKTGIDSIDEIWQKKLVDKNWQLKGKLSLQYINTESHKTEKLTLEGYLINDKGMHKIEGAGELQHVAGDQVSCVLTLSFRLNLPQLGIEPDSGENHLSPDITVTIQQSVLKRE